MSRLCRLFVFYSPSVFAVFYPVRSAKNGGYNNTATVVGFRKREFSGIFHKTGGCSTFKNGISGGPDARICFGSMKIAGLVNV